MMSKSLAGRKFPGESARFERFCDRPAPLAIGPVLLGTPGGLPIYYCNIVPFQNAFDQGRIDSEGHYFVQFGWFSPLLPGGRFTKMVRDLVDHGCRNFTMCMNSLEEFDGAVKHFSGALPICCLSEHFFTVLRHDLVNVFDVGNHHEEDRTFRAVMTAIRSGYKNRDLAREVPDLAAITYGRFDVPETEVPGAAYVNDRKLNREEINAIFSRSKMGMLLSYVEGASRTVIEYLLAGLPVITPESRGGRHLNLDDDNSVIVPRDRNRDTMRRRIRQASDEMLSRIESGTIDRHAIRSTALRRMRWNAEFTRHLIRRLLGNRPGPPMDDREFETMLRRHSPGSDEILRGEPLPPRDPHPIEKWPESWP